MHGGTNPVPSFESAAKVFLADAREQYGELGLPDERMTELIIERMRDRLTSVSSAHGAEELAELCAKTHGADLCLALAWLAGSEEAWEHYGEHFHDAVRAAARRQGADEERARAMADALPGELLAGGGQLERYHGRGSLAGWLAIIVRRRVIDAHRAPQTESLDDQHDATDARPDPLDSAATVEAAQRLRVAIAPLAHELTDREASVLLLKYQSGMPQRRIAQALGISDSRVTRLLQHAFDKLAQRLRATFPDGDPDSFPQMEQVWRELDSCRMHRQTSLASTDSSGESSTP